MVKVRSTFRGSGGHRGNHHTVRRWRKVHSLAGGVVVVSVLAACGPMLPSIDQIGTQQSGVVQAGAPGTATAGPSGLPTPSGTGAGSGSASTMATASARPVAVHEQAPQLPSSQVPKQPVWDALSEAQARTAAVAAMRAYARPTLAAALWRKDMEPMLTVRAQAVWARMQPQYLTVKKVTGAAVLDSDKSNPYWIWASVPTDDGTYRVLLNRTRGGASWLVDRIEPAQIKH